MCGIIGIASEQDTDIGSKLKKSLQWLSYRGYDSCGIAIKAKDKLRIMKDKGIVENLELPSDLKGKTGIGHTRWATHGPPTLENAHPHHDCSHQIAVVHNGIIDNYEEIKDELKGKGHRFKSETDTEVIPHLIEEKLKEYRAEGYPNHFLLAFNDAIRKLKGTFAIAAISNAEDKIYAVRKTSPLLIGVANGMHFVASDIPAFLEHTNRFVPLEDNQIAVISGEKFEIFDEMQRIQAQEVVCPFGPQEISKGVYKYYMLKEIRQQGEVLDSILRTQNDDIDNMAESLAEVLKKVRKVYFTGCGSSFHACIAGKYLFERLLQMPSEAILSSEFKALAGDLPLKESLVIILSQSGETFDTFTVVEEILSRRAKPNILAIVNNRYSSVERLVTKKFSPNAPLLPLLARPEICVVATKTYTAELFVLALLTLHIGIRTLPDGKKKEMTYLLEEAQKIPHKAQTILETVDKHLAEELVPKYGRNASYGEAHREALFVVGRGINLATAFEGALKLKEICYMSAEGMAGGELKHGSLALVDQNTPVFVLFPPSSDGPIWQSTFNNLREVQARGAPVISICCESDKEKVKGFSTEVITVPDTEWLFSPILQILPLQLLAYTISVNKGIDPDHPRNLAKTVTVE